MKKSLLIILTATLIIAILVFAERSFFLSNNKPNFITRGRFVRSFSIALIKPTFTAAAYHNAFYKFYFRYVSIPHARKNVTTYLNLLSSNQSNTGLTSSAYFSFE
ncbi:MAG: hypothetical protein WCF23_06330 [Candidatus Nitrosopolaris sp.]